MTELHPQTERLQRFMRGDLDAADSQDIVIHLLSGCEPCRRIARESFPCDQPALTEGVSTATQRWQARAEDSYSAVFEQVIPRVWESEVALTDQQAVAPSLLEELKRHPHQRRLLLVRNSRRFRSWPLCELTIDYAHGLVSREPSDAVDFAKLAIELTESLDEIMDEAELISDLQCRAHAVLGNAFRVSGDFAQAETELAVAAGYCAKGTGDQLERARLLELTGQLAGEHRDFSKALALFDEAIQIYRRHGEEHRHGRALISRAFHLSVMGDLAGSIASLKQGLKQIDGEQDPRLALAAKHNLIHYLYLTGRYHQAMVLAPETRALHVELGNRMDLARFDWLEGTILRDSGDLEAGEVVLTKVKQFFAEREIAHDTALVSLDLAAIYLRQQRTHELKELAGEMLTIFHALRVHREAIAALVLFQKAVEMERVTLGLVRDLAAYLKSSRHDPHLPFRPSLTA